MAGVRVEHVPFRGCGPALNDLGARVVDIYCGDPATLALIHGGQARGCHGGGEGAAGVVRLGSGGVLKGKGFQVIPAGDRLVVEMPGGGGMGPLGPATG